ncbi:MAG: PH domain-containing protein [Pirellulales bacterium]
MNATSSATADFDPRRISRPDASLMRYYFVAALLTGPMFPLTIIPLACKYATLRYQFDDKGISMSWGVLFRREVVLTYRRIQDIHLTRGLVQRWFGLATVAIQTASGSAGAEMKIEGILEAEPLRDFLYAQMRGARDDVHDVALVAADDTQAGDGVGPTDQQKDEITTLLREIRDSLTRLADREVAE